ncbi:MAG: hypothetical protein H8E44_40305 [Planctomycetes bacterium]|nr:hypothetical protein [Planctomycetota bacterium]
MSSRKQPHEKLNSSPGDPSVENGAPQPDEELPLDLRAVEAELNALSPRSDTFDRDQLMFRAGQLSPLKEDDRQATPRRSWLWPTGFASMTAVAATLLIMLAMRPEPTVIEKVRIVKVPVAPPDTDDDRAALDATNAKTDSEPSQPRSVSPGPTPDSLLDNGRLAAAAPGWPQPDWETARVRSPWPSLRNEILTKGLDAWEDSPPRTSQEEEQPRAPSSRRQWFDMLLDDQV